MTDRYQRDYERALAAGPYRDDALVERLTREMIDRGVLVFQSHRLAESDLGHVAALLRYFAPPRGASILDVGAGVGAVAELMVEIRSDLRFTMLNLSPAQLSMISMDTSMDRVAGHMHELPFADGSFDGVMFNFSLGHGRVDRSLAEAARVVRRGGVVFAYELTSDRPEELVELMGYRPHHYAEVLKAGLDAGLGRLPRFALPETSTKAFIEAFGYQGFVRHGFDRCQAIIYRWERR